MLYIPTGLAYQCTVHGSVLIAEAGSHRFDGCSLRIAWSGVRRQEESPLVTVQAMTHLTRYLQARPFGSESWELLLELIRTWGLLKPAEGSGSQDYSAWRQLAVELPSRRELAGGLALIYSQVLGQPRILPKADGTPTLHFVADGLFAVVASHLMSSATQPTGESSAAVLCSWCQRPLLNREQWTKFCGEDCRASSRRSSNRASWHRNKNRWRATAK